MHTQKPDEQVREFIEFVENLGFRGPERELLDIGCGKGRNAIYCTSKGYHTTGVDFSEKAIDDARIRTRQMGYTIEFNVADLSKDWPFGNEQFDIVLDCDVSAYIPDEGRIMTRSEGARVLRKGGFYLFYGPAIQPGSPAPPPDTGFHEKHYSEGALLKEFEAFTPIKLTMLVAPDSQGAHKVQRPMWSAFFQK